jgi:phosphopantothenoylcysteine decarboxylase/phosphopantothenate--cysteine ligase
MLELEPTDDILAGIAAAVPPPGDPTRPFLVGFAAETGSLDRAADKLVRKGVDLLIANDVAEEGSGFGADTNHVWILSAVGDEVDLPIRSKRAVAEEILDRVAAALDARDAAAQTGTVTQEIRS